MSFNAPAPFAEFPSDLPLLSAETLSFSRLLSDDDTERKKLFNVCSSTGVIILDLADTKEGAKLTQEVDAIFDLSEAIFSLDPEVKRKYSMLSGTILGYKGPEGDRRTGFVPHTDYGSITVLFNVLGELQVLPEGKSPEEDNWLWVKPSLGCVVINLGDAMVRFTNGLFKSPMHRVTYVPGDQAHLTRYSLTYFARPGDGCLMKTLDGSSRIPAPDDDDDEGVTAGEWVRTRAKAAQVQKEERSKFPQVGDAPDLTWTVTGSGEKMRTKFSD
ncbi:Clavaminate synthase-like protein [Lentithecium fluviatile CBS 122367]|uniref:Clavaminate synthase-like protein n=1 Tax=Lentithecium fluviatile CBS 122367 TaxID=1168545 RepID=A0A6G1JH89_9PLEO|nr:Clavaminate synthase-like protein [Lentithecium fluviatile CBS 122367]